MPAKKLPEGKKTSGLVTRTNDPSVLGSNQISCDDSDGKEMITIHGQHDMSTRIENDENWTVHNNRTLNVDVNNLVIIGGNDDTSVTGEQSLSVAKKQVITLGANRDTSITDDDKLVVGGPRNTEITGADGLTVGGKLTVGVTGDIVIASKARIVIGVGDSTIFIDSGKIMLNAPNIEINGTSVATMGVGGQSVTCDTSKVAISGAVINSSAQGNNEISGALVKIN
jgi:type VI secretion system secreted protein VgrG